MSVNSIHLSYDKTEKKSLKNYTNYIDRFSSKISSMPVQENNSNGISPNFKLIYVQKFYARCLSNLACTPV